jgi:hypothetical protein
MATSFASEGCTPGVRDARKALLGAFGVWSGEERPSAETLRGVFDALVVTLRKASITKEGRLLSVPALLRDKFPSEPIAIPTMASDELVHTRDAD